VKCLYCGKYILKNEAINMNDPEGKLCNPFYNTEPSWYCKECASLFSVPGTD
jgi:hypothetical protein